VAIAQDNPQNSSGNFAVAGSASVNTLFADTRAYVRHVGLDATSLSVEATNTGVIATLAAGVAYAAASASKSAAVGGSVTVNQTRNITEAIVDDVTATLTADSDVHATDESLIVSVAGAVGFGVKAGVGAAVAVNTIGDAALGANTTRAAISDSTITVSNAAL